MKKIDALVENLSQTQLKELAKKGIKHREERLFSMLRKINFYALGVAIGKPEEEDLAVRIKAYESMKEGLLELGIWSEDYATLFEYAKAGKLEKKHIMENILR